MQFFKIVFRFQPRRGPPEKLVACGTCSRENCKAFQVQQKRQKHRGTRAIYGHCAAVRPFAEDTEQGQADIASFRSYKSPSELGTFSIFYFFDNKKLFFAS